ncbi:AN1-type zinc finger protein 1 [Coemansia erecta]|nr:AN1-type zinc finger protein 1 [Coemansia erecta]
MELPDVGNRCSKEGCGRLDFLSVTCEFCTQTFCSEHGSAFAHSCSKVPQAQAAASACANELPISLYTHPDRGPQKHTFAESKKVLTAEQLAALEALKQSSSKPGNLYSKPKPKPKPKQQSTVSPKIALMRLKGKATGNASIDMADRLYLSVLWQEKSLSVFINKNIGVGSAAARFSTALRLSQLPDKVYRLRLPGADTNLPSNKTFGELLFEGDASGLFNGCTLELTCGPAS